MKLEGRWLFAVACLLAVLAAALVYLPGLPGDFIFDDMPNIVQNGALHLHDLRLNSLVDAAFSSPTGSLLRPVSMLSFAFDIYFFGVDAFWIKATNILIHLGCGILLWFVAREVLRAYCRNGGEPIGSASIAWVSLAAALIWAVHPLNLTSVLYSVQRETALAGLFTAAALFSYLAGRRREQERGGGLLLVWIITPFLTLLGILSKETAALLPVYVLVLEFTLLRFRGREGRTSRPAQAFLGVFLALPILAALALLLLHPYSILGGYNGRDFTLGQRLLSEARIVLDYLRWAFVPDIRQLALFHDDIAASQDLFHPLSTLFSVLTVLGLLALGFLSRRRWPLLSFGILWFFGGQLLESTVLPLELAYEHRNYLPIFGLMLGCSGTLYLVARKGGWLRGAVALTAVTVLMFGSATALRASEWSSELEFAKSEPRHHPHSPRALAELTWAYIQYAVLEKDPSVIPHAVEAAERSKAEDPYAINQDVGLAFMYASLKDFPNAKARLDSAAEDVKLARPSATLQMALQTMLVMATPENQSLDASMERLLVNATTNPKLMRDSCYYGTLWNTLGIFRYKMLEVPGALEAMNRAVQLCPSSPKLRENYASMLLDFGDTDYAAKQLEVLRQMRDIRTLHEWHELETRYRDALADKASPRNKAKP